MHPPRAVDGRLVTVLATASVPATRLLDVQGLTVEYDLGRRRPPLRAVDDVSFSIDARETVGLVGESGSGKSTIGRAILGLAPPSAGRVLFDHADITHAGYRERRRLAADLQVVFQDPYSSLNPTRTIGQTLAETLRVHGKPKTKADVAERVGWMLERVGLPAASAGRYPTHFSGGQRQRIAIARALMVEPRLVICDEPVSALDLSVQAQILNLLRELQNELKLSYLFIAHDLAVVRHLSHRIIVLYRGRIMEEGSAATVYGNPLHPYTRMLLQAAPVPDPVLQRQRRSARTVTATGVVTPAPAKACPFVPRCPYAVEICRTQRPRLEALGGARVIACHRWQELQNVEDPVAGTRPPKNGE
jgi:oligopeptide/dipeptide ABC transporter ATP-binding protein